MEESLSHAPPSDSDADKPKAAVDRFFALVAKATPPQLNRALLPLIEQNPELWEAVSAELAERLALKIRGLAESGAQDKPASAEHVDVVLELVASRLSRSFDEQFDYPGRADDIRRIEQWALYRALLEVQDLDPSYTAQSVARDAVACLNRVFVLLERHQKLPRIRKRLTKQVEDIVIQKKTSLRKKALERFPMAELAECSAHETAVEFSPRAPIVDETNGNVVNSAELVDATLGLDARSLLQLSRRARIDEYKATVKIRTGRKLTDSELSKAANPNWNDRTQINWYKFANPRQGKGAVDKIEKLLRDRPHLNR